MGTRLQTAGRVGPRSLREGALPPPTHFHCPPISLSPGFADTKQHCARFFHTSAVDGAASQSDSLGDDESSLDDDGSPLDDESLGDAVDGAAEALAAAGRPSSWVSRYTEGGTVERPRSTATDCF